MNEIVLFIKDSEEEKSFELKDKLIIGRNSKADITISDNRISSKHLQVKHIDSKFYIKDLETRNGTQINGNIVIPNHYIEIRSGDKVVIGNKLLSIHSNRDDDSIVHKMNNFELFQEDAEQVKTNTKITVSPLKEIKIIDEAPELKLQKTTIDTFLTKNQEDVEDNSLKGQLNRANEKKVEIETRLQKVEVELKRKVQLEKEITSFEEKYSYILEHGQKLKSGYLEHAKEWDGINEKISSLEKKLEELKILKSKLSDSVLPYLKYQGLNRDKAKMTIELKDILKRNPKKQSTELIKELESVEHTIRKINRKIQVNQVSIEKEKIAEKRKIQDEINRLQEKLKAE